MTRRPRAPTLAKQLEVALGWWMARASYLPESMEPRERRAFDRARATLDAYRSPSESEPFDDSMSDPSAIGEEGVGGRAERSEARGSGVEGVSEPAVLSSTSETEGERGPGREPTTPVIDGDETPPWERPATKPGNQWRDLIAYLKQLYASANAGASPTWTGRHFAGLKQLVAAHGYEEVRKRATNMWTSPPKWPPPPYALDTLVRFFDYFAIPHAATGMQAKRLSDTPMGRPDPKKHYGAVGEVDMVEMRRRMQEAAQRGERYMGPTPMKGGTK